MIRPRRKVRRERPLLVHLTTTDISLALLLGDQLEAFADAGFEVVGASAPGDFREAIESRGIRFIPLPHATRAMSPLADVKAAYELWKLLWRLRPDILHTHNPKPGIYGRLVGALSGVPVIVNTVHGLYATREDRLLKRLLVYGVERVAACFSDAELIQNPEDLATMRRLGVPSRRLHLLGNGVDLKRFSRDYVTDTTRRRLRAEIGASDGSVVILAVGRLVAEKGFRELFAAATRVLASHPSALFAVAGPMEPSKADALNETELQDAEESGIRLLGHRADVRDLYGASDVFVLASHREGFPRAAMEASAMGLPVVATDIRGCRQVVDDGSTGLLVPSKDADSLAGAIATLLDDAQLRHRMGEGAAAKAQREFDQATVIKLTIDVYDKLLPCGRVGTSPDTAVAGRGSAS